MTHSTVHKYGTGREINRIHEDMCGGSVYAADSIRRAVIRTVTISESFLSAHHTHARILMTSESTGKMFEHVEQSIGIVCALSIMRIMAASVK